MGKKAVEVSNVTYYYPRSRLPALEDVSINIDYGEFVVIAGASGGGKSTLCRILSGLIPHVYGGKLKGKVYVDGIDVVSNGVKSIIGKIGVVFQVPENQIVNLVVEEELAFMLENLGVEPNVIRKRIEEVVKSLSIDNLIRRATYTLSGGESQKVVLASTIAAKPKILLLDEPLAHLDPSSALELVELLAKLNREEDITIIVFEHRLVDLIKYASRLIILERKVIADGDPRKVLSKTPTTRVEIPAVSELATKLKINGIPLTVEEAKQCFKQLLSSCKPSYKSTNTRSSSHPEKRREVIVIDNLWHVYSSGKEALKNVNLRVREGDFIAIIGANGAGKTTLIKHLNGLLKPTRGRVVVYGIDTRKASVAELSRHVGIVFQNPLHQFFAETVLEEAAFAAKIRGIDDAYEKATKILKVLGLGHLLKRSPYELSAGEQRRLAIASILVYEPPVIVLDEPTAGLDPGLKIDLLGILTKLVREGKTVIITTHDIEFLAKAPVDRVVVMNEGRVLAEGSLREIFYDTEVLKSSRITPPQIVQLIKALSVENGIVPLNVDELIHTIKYSRCQ